MGARVIALGTLERREPTFRRDTPEDQEAIAFAYNLRTFILPSAAAGLAAGALLVFLLKR
jgi:hypothetical protein